VVLGGSRCTHAIHAMDNNISTHNQTIPTTVGALLTEESTIDPLSHLPSFLELTFVDVARNSGRRALSTAWDVGIAWLEGVMERLRQLERLADRRASRISNGEGTSSSGLRLLRVVRVLTTQLARVRVKILRRLCHLFLGTVKNLGPEIQTLIMYAIDYNCMHHLAGATACEMVYGLKRCKIVKAYTRHPLPKNTSVHSNNSQSDDKMQRVNKKSADVHYQNRVAELTKFDKTSSALLAALLPYCKERCDRWYSEWKEQPSGVSTYHPPNNTSVDESLSFADSKEKFVQLYPYFHMVHEGSIFLFQFAYLLGYTPYWSFSLKALGVMLRRMTVADVQRQQQQKQQQQQLQSQQKGEWLPPPKSTQTLPLKIGHNAISKNAPLQTKLTISHLLRGAILFSVSYTVLSGWYSHFQRELRLRRRRWIAGDEDDEDESQTLETGTNERGLRERSQLPIPPPPMPPILLDESDHSIEKWSCPICKEPRINPTASTSGYVFCYKCLVSHIRHKGDYCPVTGMPCRENKVVRLFEPTASRR